MARAQAQGGDASPVDMKLEVVVLPVSDVDRARGFYEKLGWRLDADFATGPDFRVVQMTPLDSPCSVIFGRGVTAATPGSIEDLMLIVPNLETARAELVGRGVAVSEIFHDAHGVFHRAGKEGRVQGPDPQGRSYRTWASFEDPDGNGWMLQEVKERLPGRGGLIHDEADLTALLRETEERHGQYEPTAPKHHWSLWYAGYIVARERGMSPDDAAREAAVRVERATKRGQEPS
jgi:catechol 2,3-dioxygenase-like lactoylglutathione lyase family enzyme